MTDRTFYISTVKSSYLC